MNAVRIVKTTIGWIHQASRLDVLPKPRWRSGSGACAMSGRTPEPGQTGEYARHDGELPGFGPRQKDSADPRSSILSACRDLRLLAERDRRAALRADVAAGALAQVVFLGECRVRAGLVAPGLPQLECLLLLHVRDRRDVVVSARDQVTR